MPLYLVSVKLRRSALIETIREYPDRDLERIYQKLYYACQKKYESKLEHFDCVMISKRSKKAGQFKKYLDKKTVIDLLEDMADDPHFPVGQAEKSGTRIIMSLEERKSGSPGLKG